MSVLEPATRTEQSELTNGSAAAAMTLPPSDSGSDPNVAGLRSSYTVETPNRLMMTLVLMATVLAAACGLALAAWQITRAMNGQERLSIVSWAELLCAVGAAAGLVTWTWIVAENSRRLLLSTSLSNPPIPSHYAAAWATPLVVASAAVGAVAFLERRLNQPGFDETSPVPLAIACASLIVTLFVSYRPLFLLSALMRRLGGGVGDLARWVWVPISLGIVGGFTLFGLRAGGAYGADFEGVAPAWALGVVFIPPVVVILLIGWRGGRLVEDVITLAFARRSGAHPTGAGRSGLTVFARALRADARPPISRDISKRIRLVPAASVVRLAMTIAVAALTLISIVGALVMFLFWREATGGALIPSQRQRAWNALGGLQDLERLVAMGAVGVATVWAFVTVSNVRISSGRRRNPFLAAAAWPGAAYGMWWIATRYDDTTDISNLVTRFALQALVLYVPFFLLERAAVAVGARRSPLRLAYALVAVLAVHIQGLGGLATLIEETDVDRFGRIAAYLALAALLELVATAAMTEASGLIGDASQSHADKHNFLAEQRSMIDDRVAANDAAKWSTHEQEPQFVIEKHQRTAAVPVEPVPQAAVPGAAPAPVPELVAAAPAPTPAPAPVARVPEVAPELVVAPAPPTDVSSAPEASIAPGPLTAVPDLAPVDDEAPQPEPAATPIIDTTPADDSFSIPKLVHRPAMSSQPTTIAASSPPDSVNGLL